MCFTRMQLPHSNLTMGLAMLPNPGSQLTVVIKTFTNARARRDQSRGA